MPRLATIGVYGFDVTGFLAALREADVGLLLDVRQRRGVRGREYAWANSLRLQAALAEAGIAYEHHRELAPTRRISCLTRLEKRFVSVGAGFAYIASRQSQFPPGAVFNPRCHISYGDGRKRFRNGHSG
jgi:uncharacterized protein (DUF488 family)